MNADDIILAIIATGLGGWAIAGILLTMSKDEPTPQIVDAQLLADIDQTIPCMREKIALIIKESGGEEALIQHMEHLQEAYEMFEGDENPIPLLLPVLLQQLGCLVIMQHYGEQEAN